jgi:hypothetical protein
MASKKKRQVPVKGIRRKCSTWIAILASNIFMEKQTPEIWVQHVLNMKRQMMGRWV